MATDFDLALDIWNATLQNIITEQPALATFAYTNYEFYNKFFRHAHKEKGGDYLEGHITLDSEGNAKLVGIWDQDALVKKNIQRSYTAGWRQAKGGMLWNLMETSLNSGKQKIYDVLEAQYKSAMKDIIETIYLSLLTGPTSASDDLSPNSLNTWLRVGTAASTGGWTGYQSRYNDGSTPGTAYDTAGLNSSASVNTGWASYYADHLGLIDESCLTLLDTAVRKLHFQAPVIPQALGTENGLLNFSMYTTDNVFKKLNTFYAKSDDNMGYEKNRDSHWGTPTFMSIPFAYCDILDTARTSLYGTDPIFGVNHSNIYPVIHKDWNFEELTGTDPTRAVVMQRLIYVRYQMWCENPRWAGFLVSQHPSS
jgi:hypothetical protein